MAKAKASSKKERVKRRTFTPNIDRITNAIQAAMDVLEDAQAEARKAIRKAGRPPKGSKEAEILEANRHALIDATRQQAALQGAKFSAESNCCTNFQDCPIDILMLLKSRTR